MNNIKIKELKEMTRQYCELLRNYPNSLDIIKKSGFNNNNKVTKENFEDFLNRIDCSNNKLDVQDFLFVFVSKIKDIFGNIIKENFPFYKDYNIQFFPYGDTIGIEIQVFYYYMGKQESHAYNIIPLDGYLERDIGYFESVLTDIKKDMISYPDNKIQQKFLREI